MKLGELSGYRLGEGTERAFEEGNIHEASILRWAAENLPGAPYMMSRRKCLLKKEKRIERGNKVGRQQKRHRKSRTSPNYMEYS